MLILDSILRYLGRNKVTVLAFHKVPRVADPMAPTEFDLAAFERIVDFVRQRFSIVSLAEALDTLESTGMPLGAVCITFDDGYIDWIDGVAPVLTRLGIPATFFITTGQINGMPLWHERIRRAVQHAHRALPDLATGSATTLSVATLGERILVSTRLETYLKYQTLETREQLISQLELVAEVDPSRIPRLSAENIRTLHAFGFDIGTHTDEHPILTLCDSARARAEICRPKATLEAIIGAPAPYFAYPNGRYGEFTNEHIGFVKEAGYRCALTTEPGSWTRRTSPFHIPRFTPWGPNPLRMSVQLARNLALKQIHSR